MTDNPVELLDKGTRELLQQRFAECRRRTEHGHRSIEACANDVLRVRRRAPESLKLPPHVWRASFWA
ncbi:hypothetical protein [Microbacterium sp. R86528]|uniref:hypothetical protein n=1 Tax=Microbacterium sp. R86528 TaxID=3093864 RepID=UPI0037C52C86